MNEQAYELANEQVSERASNWKRDWTSDRTDKLATIEIVWLHALFIADDLGDHYSPPFVVQKKFFGN